MSRLRTVYIEIAICIIPVIAIGLLARVATGTLSLSEIFAGTSTHAARWIGQCENLTLARGEGAALWLEIENQGPTEWTKDGKNAILLESSRLIADPWRADGSTWLSANKIGLWEDVVPVGEKGHFYFTINTDREPDEYQGTFHVVDANLKPLKGLDEIDWNIKIEEPRDGFELIATSGNLEVVPGSAATFWVRYKNSGNTVWRNYGEHPVALAVADSEAAKSYRVDNRWPDERRVAWLDEPEVAPGQEGTFTFVLQIPADFKRQTIELKPEFENLDVPGITPLSLELVAGRETEIMSAAPPVRPAPDFVSLGDLRLTVVAAEHGDCYIAQTPSGKTLVFDAAHPSRANVVVDALRRRGIEKIDYLFLSHPHWDHIGGAAEILDNFEVGQIYINGEGYPFDTYAELAKSLAQTADRVKLVARGEVIELGDDSRLEILHPEKVLSGISDNDETVNNNSLVVRLVFGETAILLPGDIYSSSMEELLDGGQDLSAAVLMLPHHGNDGFSETEQMFLAAVNPRVTVKSSSWAEWQEQTSVEMRKYLDDHKIPLFATADLGELGLTLSPEGEVKVASGELVWK